MAPTRQRHQPLRRCVVCRRSRPQSELLRWYRDPEGAWRLDLDRRAGGRGAWLCREESCWQQKALARFFRAQAPQVRGQLEALSGRSPSENDRMEG